MSKIYRVGWDIATHWSISEFEVQNSATDLHNLHIFSNLMNKYKPLKAYFIQIRSMFIFFFSEMSL